MKNEAFKLPKMSLQECDPGGLEKILEKLKEAETVFAFCKLPGQKSQFLYTGFGEPEFALLSTLIDRHIELFEFVKLAVMTTEKFRESTEEGMTMQEKSLEYIELQKKNVE